MKLCSKYQQWMVEALYGELDGKSKEEFDAHILECPECRREYESLDSTLDLMSQNKTQDPGPEYWDGYLDRLEHKIENQPSRSDKKVFRLTPSGQRWLIRALSAAALLLIGFSSGYLYFAKSLPEPISRTAAPDAQNYGTIRKTASYLEESKVLILGIVNFDTDRIDPTSMDFSRQKQASRGLVRKAVSLKDELRTSGNHRLLELVSELEIILMQICNYEKELDVPAIDLIKSGVDNQAILLKINMEELIIAAGSEQQTNKENTKKEIRL